MKKIVTKAKEVVRYQCEVCKTFHKTPAQAKKCEARLVEKKTFHVGQLVRSVWQRECTNRPNYVKRHYYAQGEVVKIRRPQLPDEDYEKLWLGGEKARLNSHVRQYEIKFTCPRCKKEKSALYYAPELQAV